MDISFIILTWNSQAHIDRCLSSILDSTVNSGLSSEIFIVDNGSCDNTRAIINNYAGDHPCIVPIYLKCNRGTTYPRNLALKKAQGELIAILDSDVEVPLGIFSHLKQRLESDKTLGLIVPKLCYPSGMLQKSTDKFPTLFSKVRRFFFLKHMEKREALLAEDEKQKLVDYAISAFWLLKHEVIKKIGLLDENIYYAPEDVDYCLRIWKGGYKIAYDPSVAAIHHAQEISRGFRINRATIEHIKGLVYYFMKHKYLVRCPDVQKNRYGNHNA